MCSVGEKSGGVGGLYFSATVNPTPRSLYHLTPRPLGGLCGVVCGVLWLAPLSDNCVK